MTHTGLVESITNFFCELFCFILIFFIENKFSVYLLSVVLLILKFRLNDDETRDPFA